MIRSLARLLLRLEMVNCKLPAHVLEQLGLLSNSPDQQSYRLPFCVLESYYYPSKAHEPLEKIARIHPAVVILPADLLSRLRWTRLQINIVGHYRNVVEKPLEPRQKNCEQTYYAHEQ